MQVFEGGVDTSVEQSLEGLFVQREFQEVLPRKSAIFIRQLPILFKETPKFWDVELCNSTRMI